MYNLWYDPGIYLTGPKKKKIRKMENAYTEQQVFTRLANIALQRYHIDGLPETISERTVLQSLLWYGSVVFFKKDNSIFALPGVPTGDGFNIYGDPGSAWVFSRYNGKMFDAVKLYIPGSDDAVFLKQLIGSEQTGTPAGVIVWENKMRYPFINTALFFTKAIADCYRTLDITRYWLKRPLFLTGPEEYNESVKKVIDDLDENPNAVYLNEMVGVQKQTNLLNTNANGQNLQDVTGLLEWYWSRFLGACGIDNNSQMDKKGENLISAEITVNDQVQEMSIDKDLDEIQAGLDNVNKFFNLNITVKKADAIDTEADNGDISEMGREQSKPDNGLDRR